jgi:hypothetical protein
MPVVREGVGQVNCKPLRAASREAIHHLRHSQLRSR